MASSLPGGNGKSTATSTASLVVAEFNVNQLTVDNVCLGPPTSSGPAAEVESASLAEIQGFSCPGEDGVSEQFAGGRASLSGTTLTVSGSGTVASLTGGYAYTETFTGTR